MHIDNSRFKFQYIPDYSRFLLENKLDEFVTVGIRFCRELNLPMVRPMAKKTEEELVSMSRESYREILSALAENNIAPLIEKNIQHYLSNTIMTSDEEMFLGNTEVVAEDIILAFYIRRKLFSFFLHSYTQNAVVHTLIAAEVDSYTTQEHLYTTKAYLACKATAMV